MDRWLRHDTNFMAHHKVRELCARAGPTAVVWHLAVLEWCKANETGGYINGKQLVRVMTPYDISASDRLSLAHSCSSVRLWDVMGENLWVIHNWNKYQITPPSSRNAQFDRALSTESTAPVEVTRGQTNQGQEIYISMSVPDSNNSRPRAREAGHSSETARCGECEMVGGRHLVECARGSQMTPGPDVKGRGGREPGCPWCELPWGTGHTDDCQYDPKHPLTGVSDSANVPEVMDNADRIRQLRTKLSRP